jgi:hypothetical protein
MIMAVDGYEFVRRPSWPVRKCNLWTCIERLRSITRGLSEEAYEVSLSYS